MHSAHRSTRLWLLAAVLQGAMLLAIDPARAAQTFTATLVGGEEVPPNPSTASGSFTGTLNDDGTFTYNVTSSGFATPFRAGHIHVAPRGVAGPIIIPFVCNAEGTLCSGTTSAPIGSAEVDALLSGGTYANLHTDAFPPGEIRGQLALVNATPSEQAADVRRLFGTATGVGAATAELVLGGRIALQGPVDLRGSTVVLGEALGEIGGTGELLRGPAGTNASPLVLALVRANKNGTEATYRATPTASSPGCRLKVKSRGRGLYDFQLDCKKADGTTIPLAPQLCDGVPLVTALRTQLVLNAASTVRMDITRSWRCMVSRGVVRELRASGPGDDGGGGGSDDNRAPRADFRMDARSGPAPHTVMFSNVSDDVDDESFTSLWDLGDGTQTSEMNPTHTYTTPGEYRVTLVVTDESGAASAPKTDIVNVRGSIEAPVEENRSPRADFRMSTKSGPPPLTVGFSNRSEDADGDSFSSEWDFGDGTRSSETNPTHTYATQGEYRVSLVVTDARGATSEPKTDIVNVRGSVEEPVEENEAPQADFRLSTRSGPAPLTVSFSNRAYDPDGDTIRSLWDFGDGTQSTEMNPTHTYTAPGEYRVSLVVTDAHGAKSAPKIDIVNVRAPEEEPVEENAAPRADFRMDVRSGPAPLTVVFSNRSGDPDGDSFTSHWDFGDGTSSSEMNPTHTYTTPGDYQVTLVVTDTHGAASAPKRDYAGAR